ncbi:phosphoglycerate dehydrogenase [Weissella halotolerans]|uniref:D-3-phosphoglycerate dehydrogenase n=1 Tax=Weissella halotolerans DSM 20190 TaxID=1123500 RepID=A0A0R2FXH6_9LACO|nr:phosphoglycerate dehydrogenase [Weissella halotolerans]KRN32347.1 D-3-phosphoglycerate dehydrogenase [Weissella halotolerans DSM 20190]
MTQKVIVPVNLANAGKDYLVQHGYRLIEVPKTSADIILAKGKAAEGLILMTDPFPTAVAKQLPELKIVARHGVGYDNLDPKALAALGIWVTITADANADTVAETTLAEILDLSKKLTANSMAMRQGDFTYKQDHLGFDLAGKTLGIMGYGRIGQRLAKKASMLDMQIKIYSPNLTHPEYGTAVSRSELLHEADILSLHMPVNSQTRHSINAAVFKQMKSSAVLINMARGALINQLDLVQALQDKTIAGAALDVFDQEPLPLTSPLYRLDNVLLTPHIASNSKECMDCMAVDAAKDVVQVLSGQQPNWPINHPIATPLD